MTVSGFLMLFLGNVELQQPVILRQHLHLADGDGVEFCQSLRLRHSLVDENRIQVLQVGQAYKLGNISIVTDVVFEIRMGIAPLFVSSWGKSTERAENL